ncbi:MAG TPA: class I SAM-dependent methyltransferase [Candidatus Magasanikbacteria bacterium]|nr:class I SAM-dependent methyltransferase [Candidatus Magasanikbacteria bacterium]
MKILKIKFVNKMFLNFFVKLHNFSYKIISRLAILENGGIHPKHKIMNYHKFFIDNIDSNDEILDIGCGKGENAYDIACKAKKVLGIDIVENNIKTAKEKYHLVCRQAGKENLEFLAGDATKYNFNKKFNKIVLSNVLEHIENRIDFLQSLHNISDVILLRVPMIDRDWISVYKKNKGFEYRLDNTHFIEYTLDELKDELKNAGWKIENYSIQFGEFWGVIKKYKN